jgi:hypothetical protein
MLQKISDIFLIIGYILVPALLAGGLYYGISRTSRRKNPAVKNVQDRETKRLYDAEEKDRQTKL